MSQPVSTPSPTSPSPATSGDTSHATTLVLLGSADPVLSRQLDTFAGSIVDQIDLRSGAAWLQVEDPDHFVERLVDAFPAAQHDQIRVAFVEPTATVDALVQHALVAPTLRALLDARADTLFKRQPPAFEVHYQPISRLADANVIGYEALLRAKVGDEIIDTEGVFRRAERGNWIGELDQLARALAIRGLGPWLHDGLIFLNLVAPGGSFDVAAINATIDAAEAAGLSPDQLVFEAVEHNRYTDLEQAAADLTTIRSRGVRIAVDDLGDGFASLRILTLFRPDIVKLSGNLTADVARPDVAAIIETIVQLAHRTDAWVVAEGIESVEQAKRLTELGCDWGQGVLLGGPLPAPLLQ